MLEIDRGSQMRGLFRNDGELTGGGLGLTIGSTQGPMEEIEVHAANDGDTELDLIVSEAVRIRFGDRVASLTEDQCRALIDFIEAALQHPGFVDHQEDYPPSTNP